MGSLNKVLLIGYLGQNPEKRVTAQGSSVVTLSLATTERYKDRSGNQQEKTEWHRVVFWNQQAETIEKYCRKGSQLYVEGRLKTREWQDKDGNKRWSTEISGGNFQFLDSASQNQGDRGSQSNRQSYQSSSGDFQQDSQGQQPPAGGQTPSENSSNTAPPGEFVEGDIPF